MKLLIAPGGTIECLYTEALPLHKWGRLKIQRASRIEFNGDTQRWEVLPPKGARVMFSHRSRAKCIEWEHANL